MNNYYVNKATTEAEEKSQIDEAAQEAVACPVNKPTSAVTNESSTTLPEELSATIPEEPSATIPEEPPATLPEELPATVPEESPAALPEDLLTSETESSLENDSPAREVNIGISEPPKQVESALLTAATGKAGTCERGTQTEVALVVPKMQVHYPKIFGPFPEVSNKEVQTVGTGGTMESPANSAVTDTKDTILQSTAKPLRTVTESLKFSFLQCPENISVSKNVVAQQGHSGSMTELFKLSVNSSQDSTTQEKGSSTKANLHGKMSESLKVSVRNCPNRVTRVKGLVVGCVVESETAGAAQDTGTVSKESSEDPKLRAKINLAEGPVQNELHTGEEPSKIAETSEVKDTPKNLLTSSLKKPDSKEPSKKQKLTVTIAEPKDSSIKRKGSINKPKDSSTEQKSSTKKAKVIAEVKSAKSRSGSSKGKQKTPVKKQDSPVKKRLDKKPKTSGKKSTSTAPKGSTKKAKPSSRSGQVKKSSSQSKKSTKSKPASQRKPRVRTVT